MEMTAMPVTEASQVGDVRRAVVGLSAQLGWNESERGAVALIATEAGTNLVKHAGRGVILFGVDAEADGVVFLILDRGPGLPHAHAIVDGFSTTGTPGLGLGSLVRLATESEFYSSPAGTAIYARYQPRRQAAAVPNVSRSRLAVGELSVAMPYEAVCGDATAVHRMHDRTLFVMCDGLGHGQAARDAADAVLRACAWQRRAPPR
jgi:anti-sigma regulatory factor (Ser/Thr protein kinase)